MFPDLFDPVSMIACFLMVLIFLQFNSHVSSMRALDELFGRYDASVRLWWARRRGFYDRHSLGLYALCFYSYAMYQAEQMRSMLKWARVTRKSRK